MSTFEPVFQIFLSSSIERHVAHVLSLFTTTVSASFATVKARHEPMLFVLQIAASLIFIGREASERSISPLQKRSKPPPVPEMPTVTRTFLAPARLKSSAAAVVYGPTVDEPSADHRALELVERRCRRNRDRREHADRRNDPDGSDPGPAPSTE